MTTPSNPPEDAELLKSVLPPLLNDFQHWFSRTVNMLENQTIAFLSPAEQTDVLTRVRIAQKQVSASQALASVTDGQAGIEMPVVMGWHKLVHECWGIALRQRKENAGKESLGKKSSATETAAEATPDAVPPEDRDTSFPTRPRPEDN